MNCLHQAFCIRFPDDLNGFTRSRTCAHSHRRNTPSLLCPVSVFECQQCEVRPNRTSRPVTDPLTYLRSFDVVLGPERHAVEPVRQVGVCCIDDSLLNCWRRSSSRDDVCNNQSDSTTSKPPHDCTYSNQANPKAKACQCNLDSLMVQRKEAPALQSETRTTLIAIPMLRTGKS